MSKAGSDHLETSLPSKVYAVIDVAIKPLQALAEE